MFQPANNPTPLNTPAPLVIPEDIEAEKSLLGRILALGHAKRGNDAYTQASSLAVSDFSQRRYGLIWRAMQKVHEVDGTINLSSVQGELVKAGKATDIRPEDWTALESLRNGDIAECVKRIASTAMQRKGLQLTDRLRKHLVDPRLTMDQRGDVCSQEMSQFVLQIQSLSQRRNVTLFDAIDDNARTFEANQKALSQGDTSAFGIPTGYVSIDSDMQMNGFKRGNLYIVAARPGTGKTSFLLNLALHAMKNGARVTFIPLEMSYERMTSRLIGIESDISINAIETGNVHPDDLPRLKEARLRMKSFEVSKKFVYLDMPPRPTLQRIEARLREHIATIGTDLIFMDQLSLQCLAPLNANIKANDFLSDAVATLKAWVNPKMFNVPLIAAAQLNRAAEGVNATSANLANSDAIGQTADVVFTLTRSKSEVASDDASLTKVDLIKHRDGLEGPLNFKYHVHSTRFEEMRS